MMQSLDSGLATITTFNALLSEPLAAETRQRVLRFSLGTQGSALLPLEQIAEVLRVEFGDVLLIPEMPRCVIGICNWRGEMLWLVDLNHFVGYPSPFQQEQASTPLTVIVIETDHPAVGLVVPHVGDIELHDLQRLQPPAIGLFSPELLPLVRGTLPGCSDAILDLHVLIHCPLWKKHPKGET
jgi:chemotaxis signal transduction protein